MKMNLINIPLILKGYPIHKAFKTLIKIKNLSISEFEEYIKCKQSEIVNFHIRHNQFYKEIVKNENWRWEDLPVLTKRDIQVELDVRIPSVINSYYINKTSGSTGTPFYFAKDKFCHALTWANIQSCFSEHQVYGKKQARFYGISQNKKEYLYDRMKDFLLNRYRFNVFNLSENSFNNWVVNFSKIKYVYLNGYTSVLILFSKYLQSKNLVLKEICPSLKKCIVTSEMCFKEDKLLMEKYFGVQVINEYGASELDLIAFQNKENEWLINTSTLFVEILDNHNNPVPDGQSGRIVITSLYNKANPFIKYDVGDIGSIQRINAKKVILKKLEGRNDDYVILADGKKAIGLTFYYVIKSIIEKKNSIKEIKIKQIEIDFFELEYISDKVLTNTQKSEINIEMIRFLNYEVKVDFKKLNHLKRTKRGKLKQFTSLINKT